MSNYKALCDLKTNIVLLANHPTVYIDDIGDLCRIHKLISESYCDSEKLEQAKKKIAYMKTSGETDEFVLNLIPRSVYQYLEQ